MNIAVNTRLLISGKLEGLGRFTFETLKRITRQHPEHTFIFIFDRKYSEEFIFADNIIPVVCRPPARHPILWYLFFDWGVPKILEKYKVDLFLSPDGWLSLRTNVPQLAVVHDLNFFHNPKWVSLSPRLYYKYFFPKFIKKAGRVATVSEFTKQDIVRRFNVKAEEIDVVYNGCSAGFQSLCTAEKKLVKAKLSNGVDYFLVLGLVHPRKNLKRVIQAYSKFREQRKSNVKLLIVGSVKYMTRDVEKAYRASKYKNDIVFSGRLSDADLNKAIASASVLLYVSLFEGFGIPILEALNSDVPVLTSSTSSMPEVGGQAALYVDPYSVSSITDGMVSIYFDKELRQQLKKNAEIHRLFFSWGKSANLLWEAMEKLIKKL